MTRSHDRRGMYGKGALPKHASVAAVEIEDPYAQAGRVADDGTLDLAARLEPFRHRNGSTAEGAPGWTPPTRPTITVIRSLKNDPLGRMHARRQIDQAAYLGGRAYQECYTAAQFGPRTSNFSDAPISGGQANALSETRRRAMARLRAVDIALAKRHGSEGVLLVRDVLGEGYSIEQAAQRRASTGERSTRSWGWLFRRCLNVLAFKFGFASTDRV